MNLFKYIFELDPKIYANAFKNIFTELFNIEAVSKEEITNFLSIVTNSPKFNEISNFLKIPEAYIEFPYLIAKMISHPDIEETILSMENSPNFSTFCA